MVKHIVLWKLREEFSPEEKAEAFLKMKASLEGLKDVIDFVVSAKVSKNINEEEPFDVTIEAEFQTLADVKAYAVHPKHLEVVKYIKSVTEKRCAIDIEK